MDTNTLDIPAGYKLIQQPDDIPEGFHSVKSPDMEPVNDPNYQRNLEAAKRANDMSVKYNIPWDHAERIATALQEKKEDPSGTIGPTPPTAKNWFIPTDEQISAAGYDHKNRYMFDEYIARPLFGYSKGIAMGVFEPVWKLFQKYKGDDMPEEWKGKSLDAAIGTASTEETPFAADAIHGLAEFLGSYKTSSAMLPVGEGLLTDKPGWLLEGERFFTATALPEVSRVIAQEENAQDAIKTTVLQTLGGAGFGKLATIEAAESAKLMSQSLILYSQARINGDEPDKAAAMAAVPFVFKATEMSSHDESPEPIRDVVGRKPEPIPPGEEPPPPPEIRAAETPIPPTNKMDMIRDRINELIEYTKTPEGTKNIEATEKEMSDLDKEFDYLQSLEDKPLDQLVRDTKKRGVPIPKHLSKAKMIRALRWEDEDLNRANEILRGAGTFYDIKSEFGIESKENGTYDLMVPTSESGVYNVRNFPDIPSAMEHFNKVMHPELAEAFTNELSPEAASKRHWMYMARADTPNPAADTPLAKTADGLRDNPANVGDVVLVYIRQVYLGYWCPFITWIISTHSLTSVILD